METKKIKAGREDRIFNITVTVISLVVLVIVLYPLYFVIIASISSPEDISLGKVRFLPSGINFAAYKFVLEEWKIWRGYLNTIFYTFFGTLLGTSVTLMAAFALSRKDLFGRNVITKLFVFTMFFSGGLIPTYMVVSSLHMVNTRTVLVVMGTVTVYNMIIARTFFPEQSSGRAFRSRGAGRLRGGEILFQNRIALFQGDYCGYCPLCGRQPVEFLFYGDDLRDRPEDIPASAGAAGHPDSGAAADPDNGSG